MSYQESFLKYLKYEKRYSDLTLVAYKKDLDQFEEFFVRTIGDFNVLRIDDKLVRLWVVEMMENGLTPRTVAKKVAALKSFYKYLLREGIIPESRLNNVILPKIRKKLPFFVEEKNMHQLLDEVEFDRDFEGVRDKLVIGMFYGTGVRLSELLNLKDADINRAESMIKVLGKRNKERVIPYPKTLNPLINQYLEARSQAVEKKNDYFFLTTKGEKVYEKLFYRIVNKNLSKVTTMEKRSPHVLRHSFATHMLDNGADLNAVKELLGHTNLSATQVYTHTSLDKIKKVYKQAHPRT
ncbi:MAG: tyrosine-type recombinase/integrase [Prolixibacteraceae bacterium]|jgi:integrase/recombinase XerC|nr:tyrosine-type recombinase/integrase [Prolixibacteraceae bacterium]